MKLHQLALYKHYFVLLLGGEIPFSFLSLILFPLSCKNIIIIDKFLKIIIMSDTLSTPKNYTLTTRTLFKHFWLLHDFMFSFSKTRSKNQYHLDAQLDVSSVMTNGTLKGTKFGQFSSFLGLIAYFMKSKNIGMKFVYGFLYVYWINHFATLGSYLGALIVIPSAYNRVGEYYTKYEQSPNILDKFQQLMSQNKQYQDTHEILAYVFPEQHQISGSHFTANDYFIKNKDKYNLKTNQLDNSNLKLPYFDSFLTRYVYHSFSRWFYRVKLYLSIEQQ